VRRVGAWCTGGAVMVAMPWLIGVVFPGAQRYLLHILVFTALFASLALSYDLTVGHVGSLSLAHPAFFGIGAYTAALLATQAGWPFLADSGAAMVLAGLVALLIGVPMFRLAEHAFAIGTLGFAMVTHIVATNWVEVTRGPLCVTGIPRPEIAMGAMRLKVTTVPHYYWLALAILALAALLYHGLTTFRLGRAFHAVRDNEVLASSAGIDPRRYRMLAFVIGAGMAGGIGAVYAHYITVLCPEEMTVALTINLLVIVFIGGVGRLRGVVIGAVLFTVLPEILRIAPTWRLVIYGALLLAIVIKWPDGLESAFHRTARLRRGGA
jgi:branched-chain amino acid transport system permease protein